MDAPVAEEGTASPQGDEGVVDWAAEKDKIKSSETGVNLVDARKLDKGGTKRRTGVRSGASSKCVPAIEPINDITTRAASFGTKQQAGRKAASRSVLAVLDSRAWIAVLVTAVHACSLLSNSFIMAEGHVARYLMATIGVLYARRAFQVGSGVWKAFALLVLNSLLAWVGMTGIQKHLHSAHAGIPPPTQTSSPGALQEDKVLAVLASLGTTYAPIILLSYLLMRYYGYNRKADKGGTYFVTGFATQLTYGMVAFGWGTEDLSGAFPKVFTEEVVATIGQLVPRYTYLMTGVLVMTTMVTAGRSLKPPGGSRRAGEAPGGKSRVAKAQGGSSRMPGGNSRGIAKGDTEEEVERAAEGRVRAALVAIASSVSCSLMLLLGRKGPLLLLLAALEGGVLLSLQSDPAQISPTQKAPSPAASSRRRGGDVGPVRGEEANDEMPGGIHASVAVEWCLLTVQLFFCTGHRCTFDGLHYTAAFTGYDEFNYHRQGALLAAETFGTSHFLPTLTLPLLAALPPIDSGHKRRAKFVPQLAKVHLAFGLARAATATMTVFFVALERRHLMVWALFAPKYMFDVIGLLLIDFILVLSTAFTLHTYKMAKRSTSALDSRHEKRL